MPTLILSFSLISGPQQVWSLAPPSYTDPAKKVAERLEHLRKSISADPKMQNKIAGADLDLFVAIGMVLGTDAIETAIRKNVPMTLAHVPEVAGRAGRDKFIETLEYCTGVVSPTAMAQAFVNDPDNTSKIVELFITNPARGRMLIEKIGGAGIAGALANTSVYVVQQFSLRPLFSPEAPVEQGLNYLGHEFYVRKEDFCKAFAKDPWAVADTIVLFGKFTAKDLQNLENVFSYETYRASFLNNPRRFARFAKTVHLLGAGTFQNGFAGETPKNLRQEMQERFRHDANAFTVDATGLLFHQWGEVGTSLKAEKSNGRARYYRKASAPACAKDLWEEFSHALTPVQHGHFKLRPFEHIVHVRHEESSPSTRFHMGLNLGRSEQERLRVKGIATKDPEIGAAEFRIENKTLIVEEIQSYTLHHQEEENTRKALEYYESWPYYLLLALEDYARAQGLLEVILPTTKYVLDHREKPVPEENILPALRFFYEEVPATLGFALSKKSLAQEPSEMLRIYRQLLQPDMFFERFVHAVEGTQPHWTFPSENMDAIGETLRNATGQDIAASQLRRNVRQAWEHSSIFPSPLIWNYTAKDKQGLLYHSLTIDKVDFIFTVNPEKHEVSYSVPLRHPSPDGSQFQAAAVQCQEKLSQWSDAAVASILPTFLDMGRTFTDDRPHAQYLHAEYLRVLNWLLESIPPDSAALITLFRALEKEWPTLRDSDKIELLHIAQTALLRLRPSDRWALAADDLEQIKNYVHWSAQMLRSNLVVSSKILRTLAPQSFIPPEFFEGMKTVFECFAKTNMGQARQAIVFYAALWLTCEETESSGKKPERTTPFREWASAAVRLFGIFDADKAPVPLRDDFLTQLLLNRRCPSMATKILWPLLQIAFQEKHLHASELLSAIDRLDLISRRMAPEEDLGPWEGQLQSHPRTWEAAKEFVDSWLQEAQREWREPYLKNPDPNILTAIPDLGLLIRFTEALRPSPPVAWNNTSWKMRVDCDNRLSQPMVSVSLMPSAKTKTMDPALDLLNLDFGDAEGKGNEFMQSPRGTIGRIDMFLGEIDGKTTLFWSERQAAKAFSKLRKCSTQEAGAYRRWLKELASRILDVARTLPEIEQVLSLSGEEMLRLKHWQHLDKQVVEDNYGTKTFLHELGFRKKTIEPYKHLEFSSIVAFMAGIFQGPFWAVDLRPPPQSYLSKFGQAEMNPKIQEAFDRTGKYQVLSPDTATEAEEYGIFGMGTLVDAADTQTLATLQFITQAAKARLMQGAHFQDLLAGKDPLARQLYASRVVAIEGLPHDVFYGTAGDKKIPSLYIPWDIVASWLKRYEGKDTADRQAVEMEVAALLLHRIVPKSHEKHGDLLSRKLGHSLSSARARSRKELHLRGRVTRAKTFGRRLKNVRQARGLTCQAFADAMGMTLDEVYNWENDKHSPQPHFVHKIEEVLQFPMDLLYLGKPLNEAVRNKRLTPMQRLNMVRYVRGWNWGDLGIIAKHAKLSKEKAVEACEKLRYDVHLVLYGKSAEEFLVENLQKIAPGTDWTKRFPEVMKIMMRYRKRTAADIARVAGVDATTVGKWLRGESAPQKRGTVRLLAKALSIKPDMLFFARSMQQELTKEPSRGNRVRKARLAMGWSVEDLANGIHLSPHALWDLEKHDKDITAEKWSLMANTLGVPIRLLRLGKRPKKQSDTLEQTIGNEGAMQYAA